MIAILSYRTVDILLSFCAPDSVKSGGGLINDILVSSRTNNTINQNPWKVIYSLTDYITFFSFHNYKKYSIKRLEETLRKVI